MKTVAAFLIAGCAALVGVILGLGAIASFLLLLRSGIESDAVTWGAISLLIAVVFLGVGAEKCIRYAGRVLVRTQKAPPVR